MDGRATRTKVKENPEQARLGDSPGLQTELHTAHDAVRRSGEQGTHYGRLGTKIERRNGGMASNACRRNARWSQKAG